MRLPFGGYFQFESLAVSPGVGHVGLRQMLLRCQGTGWTVAVLLHRQIWTSDEQGAGL